MKTPTVTCSKCFGTGRAGLDEALEETFTNLCAAGGGTAGEMHELTPGISITGLNQRLERLRAFGLVRRQREGKCWRYFPVISTERKKT